jgi:hypothetical protein
MDLISHLRSMVIAKYLAITIYNHEQVLTCEMVEDDTGEVTYVRPPTGATEGTAFVVELVRFSGYDPFYTFLKQ